MPDRVFHAHFVSQVRNVQAITGLKFNKLIKVFVGATVTRIMLTKGF